MNVGSYAKAIAAGLAAGQASIIVALTDGVVTPTEALVAGLAALVAAFSIYATPNAAASDSTYVVGGHVDTGEPSLVDKT